MRLTILFIQLALIIIVVALVTVEEGGIVTSGPMSGEPQAIAASLSDTVYKIFRDIGAKRAVVPLIAGMALTAVFAFFAGHRYTRWTNWLGVVANVVGMAYIFSVFGSAGACEGISVPIVFTPLFLLNCILFILMPRSPDISLSAVGIVIANTVLALSVFGLVLYGWKTGQIMASRLPFHTLASLAYAVPFMVNIRAVLVLRKTDRFTPSIMAASFTGVLAIMIFAISPLLGIPLIMSCFLTLAFTEMCYIFPQDYVDPESKRGVFVRALGADYEGETQPGSNG